MTTKSYRAISGFSLIEVLIAVVVLSVGLLALAALQSNLTRASSESKAQTTALGLAQQELETIRDGVASGSYLTLADASSTTSTVGNTQFSQSRRVDRYVFRTSTGASPCAAAAQFVRLGETQDTLTGSAIAALSSCYDTSRDFKRVEVSVGWTDAGNNARSVVMADIVSSASSTDSLNLADDSASGNRGPQVRIFDPSTQSGVIPIAVGTDAANRNQSVAATDPKPQTYGTSGKVSTNFTVQTYVADGTGFLLQKNFETSLISCRCSVASGTPSTGGPYSPSYWDGDKFTSRAIVTGKAHGAMVTSVDQDSLCTVCCRDHHDKTGETVQFDPFRISTDFTGGDHNHYLRSGSGSASTFTLASTAGNQYDEACRLVRVDGLFQVTTDPQLENLVLLNTTGTTAAPVIDTTTRTAYSTFARNYITSIYNAVVAGTAQAALIDYTPDPDGLSQTDPVPLAGAGQQRQLSARALFIDWLHPDTRAKLACAGSTSTVCTQDYPAYTSLTIHQIFPFLTVNLTGIGEWTAANVPADTSTVKISVTNDAIPTDRDNSYSRGRVTSIAAGNAKATIATYRGPAGLTDQEPISWHDRGSNAAGTVLDARALTTKLRNYSVTTSGDPSNIRFVAVMSNPGSDANLRTSQINFVSNEYSCTRGGTGSTDRHTCEGPSSTLTLNATVSNYNYVVVTCANGAGSPRDPNDPDTVCVKNNGTESAPASVVTRDYKICSITPSTAVGGLSATVVATAKTNNAHPGTEYTTIRIQANASSQLSGQTFTVSLYPEGTACP